MKNKDGIKFYKKLYLVNGNKENSLDYMELLNLYKFYLQNFIENDSEFYMNVDFLRYVVGGFTYYHDMIYPDDLDLSFDVGFFVKRYEELYKTAKFREWVLEDYISALIYLIDSLLIKNGLAESEIETIKQLVNSNYKINKVLSKKNDITS